MTTQTTAKAILDAIQKFRADLAEYTQAVENKIAGLELAYTVLTGEASTSTVEPNDMESDTRTIRTTGRRRSKIDRQGGAKTYAFLKERGSRPTTVAMVARKFGISPEAASQRLLNLHKTQHIARVEKGKYIDASAHTTQVEE